MKQVIARLLGGALLAMMSLALAHGQAAVRAEADDARFDLFTSQRDLIARYYADPRNGGLTPTASYLPTSARLWIRNDKGGRQDCSATVVSPRKVLTAAHCVCGESRAGFWFAPDKPACDALIPRLKGEVFLPTEGVVAVMGFDVHADYVSPAAKRVQGDPSADLAILTLARPVSVKPARIGAPAPGQRYLMASYGQLVMKSNSWPLQAGHTYQTGMSQVNRLQKARIGPDACDNGGTLDAFCAEYSSIRAADNEGKSGSACEGDSGGGLYETTNGRAVVVGVVSYVWPPAVCDGRDSRLSNAVNLGLHGDWVAERTRDAPTAASPPRCADRVIAGAPERFALGRGFTFISASVFADLDSGPERPGLAIEGIDARDCFFVADVGVASCALQEQERAIVAVTRGGLVQVTVCWTSENEPTP